jgi:hypothetical protein
MPPTSRIWLLPLLLPILWLAAPAQAAEKVVFKYGILRESVSSQQLRDFAVNGKPDTALATYVRKAGGNPQGVQQTLTQSISVDARLLDRVLNSALGNMVLDQVGQTIQTPTNTANRQALRAAIALSANPDNQLSILEIIENYPTAEVQVDGNRLAQAYKQINSLAQQAEKLRGLIQLF